MPEHLNDKHEIDPNKPSSVLTEMAEALLGMKSREKAIEMVEQTPFIASEALIESIEGFTINHYGDAALIAELLGSDEPDAGQSETLQQLVKELAHPKDLVGFDPATSEYAPAQRTRGINRQTLDLAAIRLKRISDPDNQDLRAKELAIMFESAQALFAEASVSVTAVGEKEETLVDQTVTAVKAKMIESGLFDYDKYYDHDAKIYVKNKFVMVANTGKHEEFDDLHFKSKGRNYPGPIESSRRLFWSDSRFSGQLLFHNSANKDFSLTRSGYIRTRRMQREAQGDHYGVNARMLGNRIHSPTIHWSEHLDITGYKGELDEDGRPDGITVAMPLREIIKHSPYGRDAEYATLRLKPGQEADIIPKVTINDTSGNIGGGSGDKQGPWGIDRTFYSSARDVTPDAPLRTAPDGYEIPLDEHAQIIVLDDKDEFRPDRPLSRGEHFPHITNLGLELKKLRDIPSSKFDEWSAKSKADADTAAARVQHESIQQWPDELVVPLRVNVLDFCVADDGPLDRPMAEFALISEAEDSAHRANRDKVYV